MAVLPGSLDHLYYSGIIDHIPYEAYEQPKFYQKLEVQPYAEKSLRESIINEAEKTNAKPSRKKSWVKGLLGFGVILVTACCLLKGKCKFLNPFNWFKK